MGIDPVTHKPLSNKTEETQAQPDEQTHQPLQDQQQSVENKKLDQVAHDQTELNKNNINKNNNKTEERVSVLTFPSS